MAIRKMIWQGTARAYRDAEEKTSAKGKTYAKVGVAIDVEEPAEGAGQDDRPAPLWASLMVFGWNAEAAAQVRKGAQVAFMGEAERRTWQGDDGPREHWTIMCSAFAAVGAEAGGQRERQAPRQQQRAQRAPAPQTYNEPF